MKPAIGDPDCLRQRCCFEITAVQSQPDTVHLALTRAHGQDVHKSRVQQRMACRGVPTASLVVRAIQQVVSRKTTPRMG